MLRGKELESKFIEYLKKLGYPENSIIEQYPISKNFHFDIAIIDIEKNLPIQLFEIKGQQDSKTKQRGVEHLRKGCIYLKNPNIPLYLVVPENESPFFKITRIDPQNENLSTEVDEADLNYISQRNSRIAEKVQTIDTEKNSTYDFLKIICIMAAFILMITEILMRLKVVSFSANDLAIISIILGLVLIPYASKLKILGIEFERFTDTNDKKRT